MIENKSEITTILAISKDECSDSNDFLDFIHKKKDKKNGHGEDVNIKMINIYPELYRERIHSAGRSVLFVSRENQSHFHNVIHNDMILSSQKKHIFSMPNLLVKENDLSLQSSPQSGITSKNSDNISLEYTATNNTEKLTYSAKDDYKESNIETTKAHLPYAQLKNNVLPHQKELVQKNMQPRRLQLSVADNLSKNRIDVTTKTAAIQNKSLNLDYPFLRWSGEHSVKVAIPMEQSPLRHLTLLPSDPRSAEMLSRQAGQLSGFTTQLLNPRQDDEDSERRDVKYNEEEEKE